MTIVSCHGFVYSKLRFDLTNTPKHHQPDHLTSFKYPPLDGMSFTLENVSPNSVHDYIHPKARKYMVTVKIVLYCIPY